MAVFQIIDPARNPENRVRGGYKGLVESSRGEEEKSGIVYAVGIALSYWKVCGEDAVLAEKLLQQSMDYPSTFGMVLAYVFIDVQEYVRHGVEDGINIPSARSVPSASQRDAAVPHNGTGNSFFVRAALGVLAVLVVFLTITGIVSSSGMVKPSSFSTNYVLPSSCLGYKLNEQIDFSDTNIVSVQRADRTLPFDKYEMRCKEDFGGVRFETCTVCVGCPIGIVIIAATTTNGSPEQFRLAVGRMNGLLGKPVVNEEKFVSWNYSGGSLTFRCDRAGLSSRVFDLSFISDSLLVNQKNNSVGHVPNNLFSRTITFSGGLCFRLPDGYSVTKREDDYIEISERDGTPSIFFTHERNAGKISAMAALLEEEKVSESFMKSQQKIEAAKTETMAKRGAASKIVRWGKPYRISGLKAIAHFVDFVRQDRYSLALLGGEAEVFCTNAQILHGEDYYQISIRRIEKSGTPPDSPSSAWLQTFIESLSFP